MPDITAPRPIDSEFADALRSTKQRFVVGDEASAAIIQHGAALIDASLIGTSFPGWPNGLASDEPVIETFVADGESITALSDNEPFVSAWQPLARWLDAAVRTELTRHAVELAGPAYITASLTGTEQLEGVAHMDDDTFVPTSSVGVVAIIGDLAGPRIATGSIEHKPLRPMSQITFTDDQLVGFAANQFDHCACQPNQLVVFPQFGQLHAGPAADHIEHLSPTRQLLVYRAAVVPGDAAEP